MGFKCPLCKKDFGRNKKDWENHIEICGKGFAKDVVDILHKITGDKKDE